jgi:hypothetical protein
MRLTFLGTFTKVFEIKIDMSKILAALLAIGLVATSSAFGKDVDVQLYLNQKLASKPLLRFSKPVPVTTKVCSTQTKRDRCGGGGKMPEGGCADNTYQVTGLMNLGIFSVETRRYTQYSNGTLVASWVDKVETFKSCWPL